MSGLRTRYAYAACMDGSKMAGKFEGIVKLDLSATNGGAVAGRLSHGPNRWGGEAVFASAGGPSGGAQTCSLLQWCQCHSDRFHLRYEGIRCSTVLDLH